MQTFRPAKEIATDILSALLGEHDEKFSLILKGVIEACDRTEDIKTDELKSKYYVDKILDQVQWRKVVAKKTDYSTLERALKTISESGSDIALLPIIERGKELVNLVAAAELEQGSRSSSTSIRGYHTALATSITEKLPPLFDELVLAINCEKSISSGRASPV